MRRHEVGEIERTPSRPAHHLLGAAHRVRASTADARRRPRCRAPSASCSTLPAYAGRRAGRPSAGPAPGSGRCCPAGGLPSAAAGTSRVTRQPMPGSRIQLAASAEPLRSSEASAREPSVTASYVTAASRTGVRHLRCAKTCVSAPLRRRARRRWGSVRSRCWALPPPSVTARARSGRSSIRVDRGSFRSMVWSTKLWTGGGRAQRPRAPDPDHWAFPSSSSCKDRAVPSSLWIMRTHRIASPESSGSSRQRELA